VKPDLYRPNSPPKKERKKEEAVSSKLLLSRAKNRSHHTILKKKIEPNRRMANRMVNFQSSGFRHNFSTKKKSLATKIELSRRVSAPATICDKKKGSTIRICQKYDYLKFPRTISGF
jgi:hypothetical protein